MEETQKKERFWNKKWIKNMGMGAFLFFLVKGLIWLAIFFGAFKAFAS
jgi:hypothetical protein